MSTQLVNGHAAPPMNPIDVLSKVIIQGDLSRLNEADKLVYYNKVCESMNLNPLTKPFEYITLNGKQTLYALKAATEQLRQNYGVSIEIKSRELIDDLYIVTAHAKDNRGRIDESIGAVSVANLKGEAKANALMKAETKAKRRVTLSITGLGMLDESEIESINAVKAQDVISHETKVEIISEDELNELKDKIQEAGVAEEKICDTFQVIAVESLNRMQFVEAMRRLKKNISDNKKSASLPINQKLAEQNEG